MSPTEEFIASLAQKASPVRALPSPLRRVGVLALGLLLYGVVTALVQGIRIDLLAQLARPLYVAELVALLAMVAGGLVATVYASVPDGYQQPLSRYLPAFAALAYGAVLAVQFYLPADGVAVIDLHIGAHTFQCSLCILGVAVLPTLLLAAAGRAGATTAPARLGGYVTLTAAAMGCLLMRLVEAQDDPLHILIWHNLPLLALAGLGACVGRKLFRW